MTLLAAAVAILVGWSSTGQSVYFSTVPLIETFASPEWATMMRSRNARALAERRLVEAEHAAVVLEPPAAEVPAPPGSDLDPPSSGSGTIVWQPTVERWRPLVDQYFTGVGESQMALGVMDCESDGDPQATNPSSGCAGLFQMRPAYWPGRAAECGWAGASPFDAEANIAVAACLVHKGDGENWWHWGNGDYCEGRARAQVGG